MASGGYPDDVSRADICHMEGHSYSRWGATCQSCGEFNGALFSYYGFVAQRAKRDGITREEAERRMDDEAFAAAQLEEAEAISRCPPHASLCAAGCRDTSRRSRVARL